MRTECTQSTRWISRLLSRFDICVSIYLSDDEPDSVVCYTLGDTNVIVAVYGPADCRESKQLIDRCVIEVSFRPKDGVPGVAERFIENTIKNICENVIITTLHPRSQIMVVVQIMQDRGSVSFMN